MNLYKAIFAGCLLLSLSCNNSGDEIAALKKTNARLMQEIDSLKADASLSKTVVIDSIGPAVPAPPPIEQNQSNKIRVGKHAFTLQWISWDEPGAVQIKPASNDWYTIEGGQKNKNNSDHISIKGLIKPISSTELQFKGKIESVIAANNHGEACIKEGTYIFKTTKNRKYWRLQDMINCEGGMLTDYVDIYF